MTPLPLFYYSPLSPNARRVWLALLEKGIGFT
ncbi:MAG: glutathione S-transferase N-terminal domain-containing protein, partial [Prochlorothrix sp.]